MNLTPVGYRCRECKRRVPSVTRDSGLCIRCWSRTTIAAKRAAQDDHFARFIKYTLE